MKKYGIKILEIINNSVDHLTAEEVFLKLKKDEPKIVLATVYNNLNKLYTQGKINKIRIDGMPNRYDRIIRHDHLVCINCGKLSDTTFEDFTDKLVEQFGENIIGYELKVYYVCPECRGMKSD